MTRSMICGALLAMSLGSLALGGCDPKTTQPEDTIPPDAEIISPTDGATVSGLSFLLEAIADDDAISMEITVGGEEPFSIVGPPWESPILTVPYANDAQVPVSIEAFDAAGNSTVESITVTIRPRVRTQLTFAAQNESNPTWSPDGTKIAYQRAGSSGPADIWTMDANGMNQVQVTFNPQEDQNPAWSPDGTRIAWQSNRDVKFDVFWMEVAAGEASAVNITFPDEDNQEPQWSPDGAWIYFATNRGGSFDIYRLDTTTLAASRLNSYNSQENEPVPNFDDSFYAFSSDLNVTVPHIYVQPVGSSDARLLTGEAGVSEFDPHLSNLGNIILYTRLQGTLSNIWAIYEDRGSAIRVTDGASVLGDGGGVWNPNGDRIAYHSGVSGNWDIWIVE